MSKWWDKEAALITARILGNVIAFISAIIVAIVVGFFLLTRAPLLLGLIVFFAVVVSLYCHVRKHKRLGYAAFRKWS